MKRTILFLMLSFLLFAIYGCANVNTAHDSNSTPQTAIQANPNPVIVKVISRSPVSKPILIDNEQNVSDSSAKKPSESKDLAPEKNAQGPIEYQVVFEFKGQTFATVLPYDPGESLLIQGEAPNANHPTENADVNSPINSSNGLNEIYILPPTGLAPYPYPYPALGFFPAFPVYFSAGYYYRWPSRSFYNAGGHFHHGGSRGRGRR